MTSQQRLQQAVKLSNALFDLMTEEEQETYETLLEHFEDYVNDLQIDVEREQG